MFTKLFQIGDQQSDIEEVNEIESQISSCQWRFNPFDLIDQYTTVFSCEFHRIADPTLTLFQVNDSTVLPFHSISVFFEC